MWKRTAAGRTLTFHLAGINNQNFLMRDEETGSFWQQVTGRAISGPLKGAALELAGTDEVSFAVFRAEWPQGSLLAPEPRYLQQYAHKDWEKQLARARTVMDFPDSGIPARELVAGVEMNGASRAYRVDTLKRSQLVQDRIGGTPVIVVLGPDGSSLRAFISRVGGKDVEFFRAASGEWSLVDSATASRWDFRGCATAGPKQGSCLEPAGVLKDYWFDWRNYHPDTTVARQ